ncbi:LysR family transcriptional regulator [Rubrivivax gelatinosus]|nr:LysR family transcriptional regulator [Rubrivivax gelatinosus]
MRPNGVHLHYGLQPGHQHGGELEHPLFGLLAAVQASGSIQRAATSLGASYRHVWGALKRWESELGRPLVTWTQGHPAQLTPHARQLLARERLLRARHAPQIAALRAELERLFEQAAGDDSMTLVLPATPEPALALLRDTAATRHGLHLALQSAASLDALRALVEGRVAAAAFALPEHSADTAFAAAHAALVAGPQLPAVVLRRTLGLMAPASALPGGIAALTEVGLRFAGRPAGSSADAVWRQLCRQAGISPPQPEVVEPTHEAAAVAVAGGLADVGFGSEAAAVAAGLAFRPLAHDRLLVVLAADAAPEPALQALQAALADPDWHQALSALPGIEPLEAATA